MPFTFRHFKAIFETWASYVVGHSAINDMNPGSVTRTIGEATALELAQGYVQLQNVRDSFSIDTANGSQLDERGADYLLPRLQPTKSTGVVTIGDSNLTSGSTANNVLAVLAPAGSISTLTLTNAAAFPSSGYVILDRAFSPLRQRVQYVSKSGNVLTLAGGTTLSSSHAIGATVHLSTTGADRTIDAGSIVQTVGSPVVQFAVPAGAVLLDGDYQTTNVAVESVATGASNNVAPATIRQFQSPPFPTATVTNPGNTRFGQDFESDDSYRSRLKQSQQNLSSSTASIIVSEVLKVSIPLTGQQVTSAAMVEPVAPGVSNLYFTDGTATYSPTSVNVMADELPLRDAKDGDSRGALKNWPVVPATEVLFVSLERGAGTAASVNTLTDNSKTWTPNQWAGYSVRDGAGSVFPVVSNTNNTLTLSAGGAIPSQSSYALFNFTGDFPTGSHLVRDTDYIINNTNGQFQLTAASFPTGLVRHDSVLAHVVSSTPAYTYYDGLYQIVQKTINGDPADLITYPGVKATGTVIVLQTPTVDTITIQGGIVAKPGVDESTLRTPVKNAILAYINSLGIGDDMLTSRIIDAAVSVSGVFDFQLTFPPSNVPIAPTQIARVSLSDIQVN